MMNFRVPVPILLSSACLLISFSSVKAELVIPCKETSECVALFREGSECNGDGFCTNPFYNGGCLKSLLPGWNKTRICNSQDPADAEEKGYCRSSPFSYPEVRLSGKSWESGTFNAWMIQILLSEILDVPTSVEGGSYGLNLNYYDVHNRFDIGAALIDPDQKELEVAANVQDCRVVTSNVQDPEDYEPCVHVNQEAYWSWYTQEQQETFHEYMDNPRELGIITENAFFIPLHTAEKDPSLVSHVGLAGEEHRRKLAETFKTPTTWGHYCREISNTSCAQTDATAVRAPQDESEDRQYFVDGLYTGFFRDTPESNCDLNPNCTGHFVDVPCGWATVAPQQLYHLNIALKPQTYEFEDYLAVYAAANATKSAIAYVAYTLDPIYNNYIGTDAEMTRVLLPAPTQKCNDHRTMNYCESTKLEDMVGSPLGACDTEPEMLKKAFSHAFEEMSYDPDVPEEFWSPAFKAVESYQFTITLLGEIYQYWSQVETDNWHFGSRDAVCQFVVDNMDKFQGYVPETYPRVIEEADNTEKGVAETAVFLGCFAALLVVVSMAVTFAKKSHTMVYHAQIEFMYLVLLGMLLVAIGAITIATKPSDESCVSINWLTNLGFALQLSPLLAKVSAINKLTSSGNGMQRVRLRSVELYGTAAVVVSLVFGFVLVRSIVDPILKTYEYDLTTSQNSEGATIVHAYPYCGSDEDYWDFITFAWMAAILIPGCMLAFVAGRVKEDINDTHALGLVFYLHNFFLVAWMVTYAIYRESAMNTFMNYSSFYMSVDTLGVFGFYFLPKFIYSGDTIDSEEILPDVFVHTTVALLDVQGFAAWSSVREPVQVFQFLEKLYENFDKLAEKHKVYKVETVGETYVAATGIPDAQNDHAVIMAKFTDECMQKMPKFLKKMEVMFGPGTKDLDLRVGMNSGPVTGGFLKGKGARFQIFGDTMTTASLVQSHGESGKIHLSQATATLLMKAGRRKWVAEREDVVKTLEKGAMKTYWLVKTGREGTDNDGSSGASLGDAEPSESEDGDLDTQERWIEWNVEVFKKLLHQIIARRAASTSCKVNVGGLPIADMPLEEVQEIVELPKFDKKVAKRQRENEHVQVPEKVLKQLREYITAISDRYNHNHFHNFAHASTVVQAVVKYLNRILAATDVDLDGDERMRTSGLAALHDHTYGITSDALTQFACVFSALIHDVDHPGVPNGQLIKEDQAVADKYKNRSVAEQKSLDISWALLCEDRFSDLLSTICCDDVELLRFRRLVVNAIIATDLGDKEMKALRNNRWEKAFSRVDSSTMSVSTESSSSESRASGVESQSTRINRKATIVIEHLIQAADVAHMSQHWNIYRKWNERLFREMYEAYRTGRSDSNPADFWYKGEIGFFDFYIIPLSEKLRDCGVFGPTSDENLNYAIMNRNMWEQQGHAITEELHKRAAAEFEKRQEAGVECAVEAPRRGVEVDA